MNILNVPQEKVLEYLNKYSLNQPDNFKLFFDIGRQYMEKYKTKPIDMNTKEGQKELRRIMFAMTEELFEFANTLKQKEWCEAEYPVDLEHAMEELCDWWAFVIQFLLLMNFDAEKFKEIYLKKLIVNEFRLKSKY